MPKLRWAFELLDDQEIFPASAAPVLLPPAIAFPTPLTLIKGLPVSISPSNTGGPVNAGGWSVDALPTGLSMDPDTGDLTGTPTTVQTVDSTATAVGPYGSGTAPIHFVVVLASGADSTRSAFGESCFTPAVARSQFLTD